MLTVNCNFKIYSGEAGIGLIFSIKLFFLCQGSKLKVTTGGHVDRKAESVLKYQIFDLHK